MMYNIASGTIVVWAKLGVLFSPVHHRCVTTGCLTCASALRWLVGHVEALKPNMLGYPVQIRPAC